MDAYALGQIVSIVGTVVNNTNRYLERCTALQGKVPDRPSL